MDGGRGFVATETIPVSRFVSLVSGTEFGVEVADGSLPIVGISGEGGKYAPIPAYTTDPPTHAESGDPCLVYRMGQYALVRAGGTVTAGTKVKSDADGDAVALAEGAGTQEHVGGEAITGGAEGTLILVRVAPETLTTPA